MAEMLTAKEIQTLLQVDRSTIYRMAEDGRLPAIKVGKQWRFPADQIESWIGAKLHTPPAPAAPSLRALPIESTPSCELASELPIECMQLIQDGYADLLGVMLVVTDMAGNPITEVSNPCDLFSAVSSVPNALQKCIQSWHQLASELDLQARFNRSHLGLLCARGMIRVGTELKGMVVAGCVRPDQWPPSSVELQKMADEFGVSAELFEDHLEGVHTLDESQKRQVLTFVQRIANIVAHIVDERRHLTSRLDAIASLAQL